MRIVTLLAIIISLIAPSALFADWQSTLSSNFTIAETFDNLANWRGTRTGDVGYHDYPAEMPTLSGGGKSRWTYYSFWGSYPAQNDWIQDHGIGNVWNDTGKSLRIDLDGRGYGPSRLALYFGDPDDPDPTQTGFEDVYVFHMIKMPANMFPTSCEDGCSNSHVGTFTEGQPYDTASWIKLDTANMGCPEGSCNNISDVNYSTFRIVPHLMGHTNAYNGTGALESFWITNTGFNPSLANFWSDTMIHPLDSWVRASEWWGVEYRFHNVPIDGSNDFYCYVDMWIYSSSGTEYHVIDNQVWRVLESYGQTFAPWNNFEFGGNNSNIYEWGDTMDSTWYVDDLIVNDSRIGPTYFDLLDAEESDTTPDAFTFTDVTGATRSTEYTSNQITVAGIDATANVTITGGTYSKNGGAYTSDAGTCVVTDTFTVRTTSSGSYSTAVNAVLTIGGVSDTYTVTTGAEPVAAVSKYTLTGGTCTGCQ